MFESSFLHVNMDSKSSRRSSDGDDVAMTGSTPVESASARRGLGSHGLVATSDVAKRDPGSVTQWQSTGCDEAVSRRFDSDRTHDQSK